MRTELLRAAVAALTLTLSGCATTSTRADLARVAELTRNPLPMRLVQGPPELEASREVRAMLCEPLNAERAVRLALSNNRHLRASLRELGVARGWLVQAGTLPNPHVEFDLRHQEDRAQSLQADFTVEYDLTRALLTPQRVDVARAELEAARYRAAGAVVDLGFQARAAFYAVQAAEERLALAQRALDAFAAGRDAARALFEAGNVPALDVATQEAAYEAARASVAELELAVLDRRERLQRVLGLHGEETGWRTTGPLDLAPEHLAEGDLTESRALTASLELAEIRGRLEALARRAGLARATGWLPDLSVDVHGEQDGNSLEVGGGVRMSVPLFDRRRGEVLAYESEFDAWMERYLGTAVDLRSALREARNWLRSAHARARQYDAVIVPARQRVFDETLLQYNAMQVGVFQLLQARRDLLDAELVRVEVRREYWTAAAALDALLAGRRVDGGTNAAAPTMGVANNPAGGH